MQRVTTGMSAALIALLSNGCTVPPDVDTTPEGRPSIEAIVHHIQCQIRDVQVGEVKDPQTDKIIPYSPDEQKLIDYFNNHDYVVYVNLTLDASNVEGLTPGLNFLNKAGTLTGILNFQLTGTQHRNINPTFTLDLGVGIDDSGKFNSKKAEFKNVTDKCIEMENLEKEAYGKTNSLPHHGVALKGDLGLKDIILAGMATANNDAFYYGVLRTPSPYGSNPAPAFVSTTDFTMVYGLNGGPVWSFTDFKGPGGGSTGLANASRTVKDTLVLSFAPALPPPVPAPPPCQCQPSPPPPIAGPKIHGFLPPKKGTQAQADLEKLRSDQKEQARSAAAQAAQNAATQSILLRLNNLLQTGH